MHPCAHTHTRTRAHADTSTKILINLSSVVCMWFCTGCAAGMCLLFIWSTYKHTIKHKLLKNRAHVVQTVCCKPQCRFPLCLVSPVCTKITISWLLICNAIEACHRTKITHSADNTLKVPF